MEIGRSLSSSRGLAAYLAARWSRLNGADRIAGVDLARGLAVLGMLAAHLLVIADVWLWSDPATWVGIVDGRSSILFATLAGVSIGLVTGGESPPASGRLAVALGRLAVRAGLLWALGLLLVLTGVPVHVILPAYAILFLLTLPFTRLGSRALLTIALALGLLMPFAQPLLDGLPLWRSPAGPDIEVLLGWNYPFPVWIAFLLAGLGVARAGIRSRSVQWRMLAGGAIASVLGYGLTALGDPVHPYLQAVWTAAPHSSGVGEVIGSGGFAIAVLGACLLLCTRADGSALTVVSWLTLPLRATGAMPLTAYTMQLLVWAVAASALLGDPGDLSGFRALDPFWPLTIAVVSFCTLWALLIGRGPLEWATDRLARLLLPASAMPTP